MTHTDVRNRFEYLGCLIIVRKMAMLGRYILLGLLSSLCVHVYAQLHGESKLKRLAVIGSGMGGATAAWLIHNATGCHVTVFEASDIVGGRLKETVIDERVVELGGSIGIEANRYFVETTDRLRLTRRSQPPSSVGIWDGKEFIFRSSDSLLSKFFRCVIPALCWATIDLGCAPTLWREEPSTNCFTPFPAT